MKKRLLSFLLIVTMVFTMMPIKSIAGENTFYAVYNSSDNSLTFYYDVLEHDGTARYTNLPSAATRENDWPYGSIKEDVKEVIIDESVKDYDGLRSTAYMFYYFCNATRISGAEYLNVSKVTNMSNMFYCFGYEAEDGNCVPDVSNWNTANVTDFSCMFKYYYFNSKKLNEVPDVSNWDTSNATDFSNMFCDYGGFSEELNEVPDVSNWDTSNVTDFSYMFCGYNKYASYLTKIPDISKWNTKNIKNATGFFDSYALNSLYIDFFLDLSGWDLSNLEQGQDMLSAPPYNAKSWIVGIPLKTGTKANDQSNWFFGPNGANGAIFPGGGNHFGFLTEINNSLPEAKADNNNGYIKIDKTGDFPGRKVTIFVIPKQGFRLKYDTLKVTYNDGTKKTIDLIGFIEDRTKYEFEMPAYAVDITAEFEPFVSNYNVTFDTQGASANIPAKEYLDSGSKITRPSDPQKDNCIFDGWFSDKELKTPWDFDKDVVTKDMTLYAKWISDIKITATADNNPVLVGYPVYIEGQLLDGDTPIAGEVFLEVGKEKWKCNSISGSFKFQLALLTPGKWPAYLYFEKDGKRYDYTITIEVIDPNTPKPVEVYYAPLVADLKANEEGVIEWKAGDSLPLEAVRLLVEKPELSLEFTFTYEGAEHTIFIPAGTFEQYYDVNIPWYGPAWLIERFEKEKPQKDVIEYIIVKDDTLNALAEKFKCTVEEILALNPYIKNSHWIYPNSKLLIPVQK